MPQNYCLLLLFAEKIYRGICKIALIAVKRRTRGKADSLYNIAAVQNSQIFSLLWLKYEFFSKSSQIGILIQTLKYQK